ncbi:MAG: hypothetical protein GTO45_06875, partial [Candidatus Aminicenantes bacterium]|nr:hypothetical protein [Candidatus Aminicenantes bacterium]NIM78563.1 hypothetical protein [Candidatus Aminicenantes bacterium]NIN17809.1 hypothetical protein [Candidatus Aminicenantes bacterium]NIN41713.1 hypothetical protein [Candidatus Aminicenantes bacterium]NIN84462.1 hypothetical protein [Candidatus Aminicenantes bacterium]
MRYESSALKGVLRTNKRLRRCFSSFTAGGQTSCPKGAKLTELLDLSSLPMVSYPLKKKTGDETMAKSRDLEIIKQLEQQVGKKLKQMPLEEIMPSATNGFAIDENSNIIGLNLYNSNISDISFLRDLTHLTHLKLSVNQISDILPLKELNALTELRLEKNQISDISPIKELNALTSLSLDYNQISDISPIKELNALTKLSLGDNQISDISPIKELNALIDLRLYNNQISDISPIKELKKNPKRLDLENNRISQLPIEIVELGMEIEWEYDYIEGIFVRGNPLETPPIEIIKQGTEAVRNYFKELEEQSVRLL